MSEIRVGDKVNINAEVLEITGNFCNDTATLIFDDGFTDYSLIKLSHSLMFQALKIKLPVSVINIKDKKRKNSEIRVGDKVNISAEVIEISEYPYEDSVKLRLNNGFKIQVSVSFISNKDEDRSYAVRKKEDTDVPLKAAPVKIIKDFALQANDIDFSYRRMELADNNGISTVEGEIDDKEVCSHLYEDILLDPIDNERNVDPNGTYECVIIKYQFRLQKYEIYNPERTCPHCGHVFKLDFKNYMLERNAFLKFYPVYKYKDANGKIKISFGHTESIYATTEDIWNKYRFKDALEVYDKIYDTDWTSKLDIKGGLIHE